MTRSLEGARDAVRTLDDLVPQVYDELRAIAHHHLAAGRRESTLDTTGLVHEAYLKLVDESRVTRESRAYFFGAASRAMRQVMVDAARRRRRLKRGGGDPVEALDEMQVAADGFAAEILDLEEALIIFGRQFARAARVVECRFFGGLSVEETAAALGVAPRTVKREWALARAWLYRALAARQPASG